MITIKGIYGREMYDRGAFAAARSGQVTSVVVDR
jgi:hypothetical protein